MGDLELLCAWLNAPHVRRWYGQGSSYEAVVEKYAPRIEGRSATASFLILYAGTPVGYIQTYMITDYPEYARDVGADEGTAGLDIFIGEAQYMHRGLGAHILRRFMREIVFARSGVAACMVGPEPANTAAIRAYEKAGMRHLRTVDVLGEPHPEYLMGITREELLGG